VGQLFYESHRLRYALASRPTTERVTQVTLYVDVDQDLYHTSYIYTGLFTLEKQRKISLQLCYPKPGDWRKAEPLEILVHVDVADPQTGSALRGA
jgi:hypothetical protein